MEGAVAATAGAGLASNLAAAGSVGSPAVGQGLGNLANVAIRQSEALTRLIGEPDEDKPRKPGERGKKGINNPWAGY
jgi:hypothetical protein